MFEVVSSKVPSPESIARLSERFERRYPSRTPESAALVDRICSSARAENRAAAAQLVAIGELFALRLSRCRETEEWAVDTEAAVAAEVAAALRISQGLAGSRLRYARAMREQLPRVAEVFTAGDIDIRLFQTMVYRTGLITDREVLAAVDGQLAAQVTRWPSLTMSRLAGKIDRIVAKADADAVRRRKERQAEREIAIHDFVEGGLSEIRGSLFTTDARAVDKALDALAATVCEHDPRSREQRRADAMGALAARADRLGCRCGRPDCVAGGRAAASQVVIHVIAEQATVDGTGDVPGSLVQADGLIPPELIAELAKTARLAPLVHPDAPPEPGYVPSKALADFVRCRDLTCRWPGCDRPALDCDIDHTIPHGDGGPTHPSNLKCYCRTHHLVKTFWGWHDQQLPDGTLILTSPSGQTYVTTPGSSLFFPQLCTPTGDLKPRRRNGDDHSGDRTAMMPRRRRTRAQHRAARITTERNQNRKARQVRRTAFGTVWFPKTALAADDDPPPF